MVRDVITDIGLTGVNGTGANSDRSPDIWVRNIDDGLDSQFHESPEFQPNQTRYVYVRVRNKSCIATSNTGAKLSLYWSKASGWGSWPGNWNGSNPHKGNKIGTITLPDFQPGESRIFKFAWNIANPRIDTTWNSCLLARIEDCAADPITINAGRLDLDVRENNNIAMRNITILDLVPNKPGRPTDATMFIENSLSYARPFNLHFTVPDLAESWTHDITREAEVTLTFDSLGWAILEGTGQLIPPAFEQRGIRTVRLMQPDVILQNVLLPAGVRFPLMADFHFLTDEMTENRNYQWVVTQRFSSAPQEVLGTETFSVTKYSRTAFAADAGPDASINARQAVTFTAQNIGETATYNWYNETGGLIGTGPSFTVNNADTNQTYRLEVTSGIDGFKDYDSVRLTVNHRLIQSVSPVPATTTMQVSYQAENVNSLYFMLVNSTHTTTSNFSAIPAAGSISLHVSTLPAGVYTLVMVCDGVITDSRSVQIQ